jgi:Flp pilus assembly protein TadD
MDLLGPWGLPVVVLAVGGVVAFIMSRSLSDTSDSVEGQPLSEGGEQPSLELIKASLVNELKELESIKSTLDPAVYDERRADIVAEGARIVEAISTVGRGEPASKPEGFWLVGTVIAAFLLFVIMFAKEAAQPRLDGEGMTGGGAPGQTSAPPLVDPRMAAIQAEMEAAIATLDVEPNNLEALNLLTHEAIMSGELAAAMQWSTTAREVAPSDPEVVVHSAALAMRVGMFELALERLMAVLEEDPNHLEARWWMAVAIANTGDLLGSKEALAPLLGVSGEYGQLANLLTIDLDLALADQTASEAPIEDSVIDEEPSIEEGSSEGVSLVISMLEPELYSGGGTLFVAAVRSESGGGPPLAARRIENPVIPMELSIGPNDSIFPGEWPEQFWVRARIDFDGDPATDSAGEFVSELWGPLSMGAEEDLVMAPVQ